MVSEALSDYVARAQKLLPDLSVDEAQLKTEGQANDVLVINDELVFRFPRNDAALEGLRQEAGILAVLPRHIDVAVAPLLVFQDDCMVQRKLAGEPLDRDTLLRQRPAVQERLVEEVALFLFQLHRVPEPELRTHGVGPAKGAKGSADAKALLQQCERELFPHLKDYAQVVIRKHFEPVIAGTLDLSFEPVLIHGDLNPSHLLWDPSRGCLAGILDFGMAGLGDSAIDCAGILLSYGETPLRRMHAHHASIGQKIDQARFWSFALELQLALAGLDSGEAAWFCSHLGTARDRLPIGTAWTDDNA